MKRREAKSYSGSLYQQLAFSESAQKKMDHLKKQIEETTAKEKELAVTSPAERKELETKLKNLHKRYTEYEWRKHDPKHLEDIRRNFEQQSINHKIWANTKHRLLRDYGLKLERMKSKEQNEYLKTHPLNINMASVAAALKIAKGLDDSVAINEARGLLSFWQINSTENVQQLATDIVDSILIRGDSSEFLKQYRKRGRGGRLPPREFSDEEW